MRVPRLGGLALAGLGWAEAFIGLGSGIATTSVTAAGAPPAVFAPPPIYAPPPSAPTAIPRSPAPAALPALTRSVPAAAIPSPAALAQPTPAASAAIGEPPAAPFLRIETGMHTAIINRVAVDGSGRLAATASDDKTVRLWSLPEGRPVGTLRVPIGETLEGSLYSVAVSPSGKMVAASGASGDQWDGRPALYFFDVATQKIKARLSKLPNTVLHLAFSPDGKRLAAVFGGGAGLIVYDMSSGRPLAQDPDYGNQPANWVSFDAGGRMATTGFDGFVRLYDPAMRLVARAKLPGAGRPFSVAF